MICFTKEAWEHYIYWQDNDKNIFRKINQLIKDCLREPYKGLGKPEPLKHGLSGFWLRKIDNEHRLIYKFEGGVLSVLSCRFHYDDH